MSIKIIASLAFVFTCNYASSQTIRSTQLAKELLSRSFVGLSLFSPLRYPWHRVETTVFWCMEPATSSSPSNYGSIYDPIWFKHFQHETKFYAAVPYSDIDSSGHTKQSASLLPWFKREYRGDGISVMKNRWIEIRKGSSRCFAQIKDVGPYHVDDIDYILGKQPPQPHEKNAAALDVSPSVQTFLGLNGLDVTDWRFCGDRVPNGPWTYEH